MKRILFICLSLLFIVSLCACGDTDEIVVETTPSVESEAPSIENSPETNVSNKYEFKGEFLKEYSDEKFNDDSLEINKFLGTAIVKMRPEEYQISDIPVISPDSPDAERVFTLLHLDPDYLLNYAISASSSSTRAYTFAIMQAAPYSEELIIAAIETRIADLYSQVKEFPDQLHLVENCIVTQLGDFVVFIVCDNQDMVLEELTSVFGNMDLNTINIVPFMTDEERQVFEDKVFEEDTSDIFSDVGEVIVTPVESEEDLENIDNESLDNIEENIDEGTDTSNS